MEPTTATHSPKMSGMTNGIVIGIAMLIVGGLIGFGISKGTDNSSSNMSMAPSSATKAADLRASLVNLGVQHMSLTDQAVAAALDGSADAPALDTALNANGKAIGAAVGSVYGTSAQDTFDTVWQIHLDDFVKYAVADKGGDSAGMSDALKDIQTRYTVPLSQYLAKANPNLPEAALQSALEMHVTMTAQMIDDHVKANYTAEADELAMANTHITSLFSTLAAGIVTQYPAKF
jgi:hypothetical protein